MTDGSWRDCEKIIKMISRMGSIVNIKYISSPSKETCWAEIEGGKIHTLEDNERIIKGISLQKEQAEVFIEPQVVNDELVSSIIFEWGEEK